MSSNVTTKAITSLFSVLLLAGCSHEAQKAPTPETVTGLEVAQARLADVPATNPLVGTVRAHESATLSAQMMGRVSAVLVHEGDAVRAGQVLVRLDDAAAQANVDQSNEGVRAAQHQVDAIKAQADLAASTLARYQKLRDQNSVSPQEFDEVSRRAQSANAQLQAAKAQLAAAQAASKGARTVSGYSVIVAPFAGVVTARHVDPGALAAPGSPLVEVDRSGPMQLVVSADESILGTLRPGAAIQVSIPAASSTAIAGKIAQIVPAADPSTHTFEIKIDLPATRSLLAGMYGTAYLGSATRKATLVPRAAIMTHGTMSSVWVVDAQHLASIRYVTLGSAFGQDVEVLSGLNGGEVVVLSPQDRELGGKRVEVAQ